MPKSRFLKYYLLATVFAAFLGGCQALKPASQASIGQGNGDKSGFLNHITISSGGGIQTSSDSEVPEIKDESYAPRFYFNNSFQIEQVLNSQFKYAILMDTEVEQLSNQPLYRYIDDWWATPYRLGGDSKKGIDCSAFVQGLMGSVYGLSLPRVAREQKDRCRNLVSGELQEGDLVFFNTRGGISHVGVYLHNQYFVHASTSGGIMISSLEEAYWKKRFVAGGRPQSPEVLSTAVTAQ